MHNGCDFTKQMLSNEQPGSQPSSFYWWILTLYQNFLFFPGLYSEFTACIVHQISGTNFKEWCKWTSHKMGTFSSKYYGNNTKLHEKLSDAAGVEINHLIIMQWFNHILVYYITIVNVMCERFSPFHNGQWLVWFVVMNKTYNNKHDVFCSFSFLLNVVDVKWVNECMNISEKFAWSLNVIVCLKVTLI